MVPSLNIRCRRWGRFRVTALSVFLAAAVPGGCANYEGISPRLNIEGAPALEASATIGQAQAVPSPWPQDDWWRSYGDPQLDALIAEALQESPTLQTARARIDQANAAAQLADANRQPQATAGLDSTRQRFSEHYLVPPPLAGTYQNTNRLALDFSYEFDFWGKHRAALDAALSRARAAEVDAQGARLLITSAIARSYAELDRQFRQREVAEAARQQREQISTLTRSRVRAGLDSQVELRQAEAAVPAARGDIAAIEERIASIRHQLAALTGAGPDRGLTIGRPNLNAADTLGLPTALPADLIGRRPDVVAQRWRVEAAAKEISSAKSAFYPNIDLVGFIGFSAIGLDKLFDSGSRIVGAGPALRLPIFDGGRLRANLAGRDAEFDAAVAQYRATLVDALRDVADQLAAWRAVEAQLAEQRRAQAQVEEAYRLALLRYREGLANYLNVLATQTQVLAQRRLQADLLARRIDIAIGLTRALGGGFGPDGGAQRTAAGT
ncbi:MAG: efflux transporter outer membrane subunit [Rhodocyclaceae bacterium]